MPLPRRRSSMARVKDYELCKEVLSLLEKLSCGWREPQKKNNPLVNRGTSSQLVELYKVKQMYLVWAVDTQREISHHIQVLKFWAVKELSDVLRLSEQLDRIYESYTSDKMSRCKYKHVEGNLVVPMRWEVDSASEEASTSEELDPVSFLSNPLASLNLRSEPETSSATTRFKSFSRFRTSRSNIDGPSWRSSHK